MWATGAIDSGNLAYAYTLFGSATSPFGGSASFAGIGSGIRRDNLAISQGLGGGAALACAGTANFGPGGCSGVAIGQGLILAGGITVPTTHIGFTSHNEASASAVAGIALAEANGGSGNEAAALAVQSVAGADATGTGSEASAWALGGSSGPTTAVAVAAGVGADADASAQGAGSLTGATAAAEQIPGSSLVSASSGLGGDAFASNSGGIWTVSLNGATLIG